MPKSLRSPPCDHVAASITQALSYSIENAKRLLAGSDRSIKLTADLEVAVSSLYSFVSRSVFEKSSTSFVVLGARGSGKSVAVGRALEKVRSEIGDVLEVVTLSGLLHADPRTGFDGIARAFRRGEKTGTGALATIEANIKRLKRNGVALVVVLDDFEKFVVSGQEVLYNLMNIVQCRELCLVLIGMSTKIDALDGLEKRVNSRFSHRKIILTGPKSFADCESFFKDALTGQDACCEFKCVTKKLLESRAFRDAVDEELLRNNSLGRIVRTLTVALDSLALSGHLDPQEVSKSILQLGAASSTDSFVERSLRRISVLELCVLTALMRLEHGRKDIEHGVTFDEVYDEYQNLGYGPEKWGGSEAVGTIYGKALVSKALERITDDGLARWSTSRRGEARLLHLNVAHEEVQKSLKSREDVSTVVERWGTAWLE